MIVFYILVQPASIILRLVFAGYQNLIIISISSPFQARHIDNLQIG